LILRRTTSLPDTEILIDDTGMEARSVSPSPARPKPRARQFRAIEPPAAFDIEIHK
jgi:hypothetical protein